MRLRTIMTALTVTTATLAVSARAAPVRAATTCTWGGTTLAPTGRFTLRPGNTNTPATRPLRFNATGRLAGGDGCNGTFTFDGVFDPGSTCLFSTFHGIASGLPGVARFAGSTTGGTGMPPTLLYDRAGHVVGEEQAPVLTVANAPHFTDCNTSEGFTGGNFSSTFVLFGN